jgi:peptidoglycan L-alanyl-D-glutamate endopeptidase CwlK
MSTRKFSLSTESERHLSTCCIGLQCVAREAAKWINIKIIEGHRKEAAQNTAFRKGLSQLKFPKSKHNKKPSLAVHAVPFPLMWPPTIGRVLKEIESLQDIQCKKKYLWKAIKLYGRFYRMIGFIHAVAHYMKVPIRSGDDWDHDGEILDNHFNDLSHIEMIEDE